MPFVEIVKSDLRIQRSIRLLHKNKQCEKIDKFAAPITTNIYFLVNHHAHPRRRFKNENKYRKTNSIRFRTNHQQFSIKW